MARNLNDPFSDYTPGKFYNISDLDSQINADKADIFRAAKDLRTSIERNARDLETRLELCSTIKSIIAKEVIKNTNEALTVIYSLPKYYERLEENYNKYLCDNCLHRLDKLSGVVCHTSGKHYVPIDPKLKANLELKKLLE